uniref:Uncharacterized protein n=1 Tax=Arundo donax TaxID=35708 RepID=A0A0A9FNA7_ARUDO
MTASNTRPHLCRKDLQSSPCHKGQSLATDD